MSLDEQLKNQQSALAGFKKPEPATPEGGLITGVSIPVQLERNGGKLRMQINLNPSVLQSPEALNKALDEIEQVFDLDIWKAKAQANGGGFKKSYNNNRY